ncbi:hypothetical protein BUE76_06445 [Cnuella takakiae]|nr:hypothetical protein BUE76_06445 [Cnuella takakiae]
MAALLLLCYWLFDRRYAGFTPLYFLLLISIGYKILKVLFEWYHYWNLRHPAPPPPLRRQWTVDMFTTAMPGEPFQLIEDTLKAMVAVRYPHTTYLCDEGNDPQLKALCDSLGVRHMTREIKVDAKAGNINNALRSATGDICVILDPDHRPVPQLLDETLPYFEDFQIGFVQSVQGYKNAGESPVARGAAEQTYTFYGPLMMGMGSYGTAQAIGANCVFRRAALDSIGGHAPGLSEDMHTAMRLHAKGWKSVYVPKILTRGLVPSNISAYYKQQLKWSRGTFDLLFWVLPKIFGGLTWRQKLHYSLIPLHFAAGIIALIDIIIPLAALLTGESPLLLEFSRAYLFLLPFFVLVLLTRQYAQNWLMEPAERGLHLTGGVLLFGTWWVHLVGFIYTLLGIKVPYIPTPKDDEYSNHFKVGLPNLLVVLASGIIIAFCLHYDSNPYNLVMAGYAALNMVLLFYVVLAGLDGWRMALAAGLYTRRWWAATVQKAGKSWQGFAASLFGLLSRRAPQMAFVSIAVFLLLGWQAANRAEKQINPDFKATGGFYLGLPFNPADQYQAAGLGSKQAGSLPQTNVLALPWSWDQKQTPQSFITAVNDIARKGAIPLVTWLPVHFAVTAHPAEGIFTAIARGRYDGFIRSYAKEIRELHYPVFLNFAPESDNPAVPWTLSRQNPLKQYLAAMRRVKDLFNAEGANNVSWIWTLWHPNNATIMYPGADFVDWVGINLRGERAPLTKTYAAFHKKLHLYRRPVMLMNVPVQDDAMGAEWMDDAAGTIKNQYREIRGLVLGSDAMQARESAIQIKNSGQQASGFKAALGHLPRLAMPEGMPTAANAPVSTTRLHKTAKGFQLMVGGKPFYIKGVAYNLEHSWRDGYAPLNRKKLEADFKAIKAMGANTIRRYAPSLYDRNILAVAREQQLKVMYGFWFDPKNDYHKDRAQVAKYLREVTTAVRHLKDDSTIIAWNIGNETSGILKDFYAQPYLTQVRRGYMEMIEELTRAIHAIDPVRPVISSLEHTDQLPGELYNFNRYTPSLDAMGINSYYTEQIGRLHGLVHQFYPHKPYVVTEFGPAGYWSPRYTRYDRYFNPIEDSDKRKAELYMEEWQKDVQDHAGCNLGGVAYCWQDRYEGSATWFGITSSDGKKKLVYSALQHVWAGTAKPQLPHLFIAGPTFQVKPGGAYQFTVVHKDSSLGRYSWKLLRDDYLEEAGKIYPSDRPDRVWVFLPAAGARFRLYVVAETKDGKEVSASFPINLYQGVLNSGL